MTPPTDTQGAGEMVSDDFAHGIEKLREVKAMLRQEERLEAMSRIGWAIEELLATRRDAGRYRWLRDWGEPMYCIAIDGTPSYAGRTTAQVDAAIDAAMSRDGSIGEPREQECACGHPYACGAAERPEKP